MKTYEVEFRRVSFITYKVEADNAEQAETLAWRALESDYAIAKSISHIDASFDVESIEEQTP